MMLLAKNPYIAGNPVGGEKAFVGRIDIIREATRLLATARDNAILLYGQRRIGKTSILQELAQQLPHHGPYHPVYFDLQDKAARPLPDVLQALARCISYTLSVPDPEAVDFDQDDAFAREFLPPILNDAIPPDASLVLLLDEFDVLDNPQEKQAGATFFPYLRQLMALDRRRLQFVFVIGRKPDDLKNSLSLFKGVRSKRISLLKPADAEKLIRLAEGNETLRWTDEAVAEVYRLTNGHPYLTQQLCQLIWDNAYEADPETSPTVARAEVEAAISDTLASSVSALEWLWSGLGASERVVAAVLAQAGSRPISQRELEQLLADSGVRVIISELQNAPHILKEWDLIEPVETGYRFRVELLRRWIANHKPVGLVQPELDYIEPTAHKLYEAACPLYRNDQLDQAVDLLRQTLTFNPNHLQAGLLLAQILLAQTQLTEAVDLLETIYAYNPQAARPRLVQALIAQAKTIETQKDKLALYDRILALAPDNLEIIEARETMLQQLKIEASAHLTAKRSLEAMNLLEIIYQYMPQTVEPLLIQALLQEVEKVKSDSGRLELYNRILRLDPDYPEAVTGRETILTRLSQETQIDVEPIKPFRSLAYTVRLRLTALDKIQAEFFDPDYKVVSEPASDFGYIGQTKTRIQELHHRLEQGQVNEAELKELGERLFNALFRMPLRQAFISLYERVRRENRALRLELDIDEESLPEAAAVPWELMHMPPSVGYGSVWLGASPDIIFSRRSVLWSTAEPIRLRKVERLRIALVVASPNGLSPINYEETWEALENLAQTEAEQIEVLDPVAEATPEAIDNLLAQQPHIFHFVGHSRFDPKTAMADKMETGQIALVEAESGQPDWHTIEDLGELFARHRPRLVLLQSDESAAAVTRRAFLDQARRLVRQNIPAVLTLQHRMTNASARRLISEFYRRLAHNDPVDRALQESRRRLLLSTQDDRAPDFAAPVLFTRVRDGKLFQHLSARPAILDIEPPYGTMDPDSRFYIERSADEECKRYLGSPYPVTLFLRAPRQMGKSSLMRRVIDWADKEHNQKPAFIDFQAFPKSYFKDEETFFIEFSLAIGDALGIPEAIDKYWQGRRANITKCGLYLSKHILPQIDRPIILAMDEVDRLSISPFRNSFFGMLRVWHNRRARDENFTKMSLFLSGSTEPYLLIDAPSQSPFNVGTYISLEEFTPEEISELNQRHNALLSQRQINELMNLIGGHPFLIRLAFYLLATEEYNFGTLMAQATQKTGPFGDHLNYYLTLVAQNPEFGEVLNDILRTQTFGKDWIFYRLESTGLIKRDTRQVVFRNELYRRFFEEHLTS